MTVPSFYDPKRIGQLYKTDPNTAIAEGLAAGLSSAANDPRRVLLLLVDPQIDFIHSDGALSVPGAIEDTQRTLEWIYQHTDHITVGK